ncbi:MAG: hypothetical protein HQL17_05735, partial [Candidatus Omnitrophica bacterium]|nr:hypothetical protein [Candidatus Omnitrophota bacterium]
TIFLEEGFDRRKLSDFAEGNTQDKYKLSEIITALRQNDLFGREVVRKSLRNNTEKAVAAFRSITDIGRFEQGFKALADLAPRGPELLKDALMAVPETVVESINTVGLAPDILGKLTQTPGLDQKLWQDAFINDPVDLMNLISYLGQKGSRINSLNANVQALMDAGVRLELIRRSFVLMPALFGGALAELDPQGMRAFKDHFTADEQVHVSEYLKARKVSLVLNNRNVSSLNASEGLVNMLQLSENVLIGISGQVEGKYDEVKKQFSRYDAVKKSTFQFPVTNDLTPHLGEVIPIFRLGFKVADDGLVLPGVPFKIHFPKRGEAPDQSKQALKHSAGLDEQRRCIMISSVHDLNELENFWKGYDLMEHKPLVFLAMRNPDDGKMERWLRHRGYRFSLAERNDAKQAMSDYKNADVVIVNTRGELRQMGKLMDAWIVTHDRDLSDPVEATVQSLYLKGYWPNNRMLLHLFSDTGVTSPLVDAPALLGAQLEEAYKDHVAEKIDHSVDVFENTILPSARLSASLAIMAMVEYEQGKWARNILGLFEAVRDQDGAKMEEFLNIDEVASGVLNNLGIITYQFSKPHYKLSQKGWDFRDAILEVLGDYLKNRDHFKMIKGLQAVMAMSTPVKRRMAETVDFAAVTPKYTSDKRNLDVLRLIKSNEFEDKTGLNIWEGKHKFVDVGVGNPPVTTIELKQGLDEINPDIELIGTDDPQAVVHHEVSFQKGKKFEAMEDVLRSYSKYDERQVQEVRFLVTDHKVDNQANISEIMVRFDDGSHEGGSVYVPVAYAKGVNLLSSEQSLGTDSKEHETTLFDELMAEAGEAHLKDLLEGKGITDDVIVRHEPTRAKLEEAGVRFEETDDLAKAGIDNVDVMTIQNVLIHYPQEGRDKFFQMVKSALKDGKDGKGGGVCVVKNGDVIKGLFVFKTDFYQKFGEGDLGSDLVYLGSTLSDNNSKGFWDPEHFEKYAGIRSARENVFSSSTIKGAAVIKSFLDDVQTEAGSHDSAQLIKEKFLVPMWGTLAASNISVRKDVHLVIQADLDGIGSIDTEMEGYTHFYINVHRDFVKMWEDRRVTDIQMAYIVALGLAQLRNQYLEKAKTLKVSEPNESWVDAMRIMQTVGYSDSDIRNNVIPFVRELAKVKKDLRLSGADPQRYVLLAQELDKRLGQLISPFSWGDAVQAVPPLSKKDIKMNFAEKNGMVLFMGETEGDTDLYHKHMLERRMDPSFFDYDLKPQAEREKVKDNTIPFLRILSFYYQKSMDTGRHLFKMTFVPPVVTYPSTGYPAGMRKFKLFGNGADLPPDGWYVTPLAQFSADDQRKIDNYMKGQLDELIQSFNLVRDAWALEWKATQSVEFENGQFWKGQSPEGLIEAIRRGGFEVKAQGDPLKTLNALLQDPLFSTYLLRSGKEGWLTKDAAIIVNYIIRVKGEDASLTPAQVRALLEMNFIKEAPTRWKVDFQIGTTLGKGNSVNVNSLDVIADLPLSNGQLVQEGRAEQDRIIFDASKGGNVAGLTSDKLLFQAKGRDPFWKIIQGTPAISGLEKADFYNLDDLTSEFLLNAKGRGGDEAPRVAVSLYQDPDQGGGAVFELEIEQKNINGTDWDRISRNRAGWALEGDKYLTDREVRKQSGAAQTHGDGLSAFASIGKKFETSLEYRRASEENGQRKMVTRLIVKLPNVQEESMKALKLTAMNNLGGIDLTAGRMNLESKGEGAPLSFSFDPAMITQFQNASGFTPVIISVQPMKDLPRFLGLQ